MWNRIRLNRHDQEISYMKRVLVSVFALSALIAAPAWAADEKPKAKDSTEASEPAESGVESIAEEAEGAAAEIPEALQGDEPSTESNSD
jgi:hypothetical protein